MPNRVILNADGYIEQIYVGHQTSETLAKVVNDTAKHAEKLRKEGRPVYILVDITRLGALVTAARKAAVDAIKTLTFDRMAVHSTNTFKRALSSLIIYASGKSRKIKMFETRADAEQWLLQQPNSQAK